LAVLFFATSYQVSKKELGFRISQGNWEQFSKYKFHEMDFQTNG
jgi:hypothetical protein